MKTIMLNIMNKHAPLVQRRIKGTSCPWLNSHIRKEMKNRDYHPRKAERTKAEVDWSTYKRLRNRVNRLTDKAKQSYNKNLLTENANDPKRFCYEFGRWHNN